MVVVSSISVIKRACSWLKKPLHTGLVLIIAFLVAAVFWLTWHYFVYNNNGGSDNEHPTLAEISKMNSETIKRELAQKDYGSYQSDQNTLAESRLGASDTKGALKVMQDTIKNVPSTNVEANTYALMAQVQKASNNSAQQKIYLQLYMDKVKAETSNSDDITPIIDSVQKELDSLQ